ncbi:MAG: exonuclease SbcCD subunit D [Lachnospiraceae bacterium]
MALKFIHLGDLHIGKMLGDFDLLEDQSYILQQILKIADDNQVDGVLIAGDIYDRSIPSEGAVSLFDWFVGELAKRKLKTFMISGNHDSDERLNFGSSLFTANEIFISAKYNGQLYKKTLQDDNGNLNIYLMPFIKASQVKHFYPEEDIVSYDDAVRVAIEKSNIKKEERNVLVAHQYVIKMGSDPILAGSESMAVKNVGTIEKINAAHFDDFDYVALGHIHSAQEITRETIRYSGSPLKYSLSEAKHTKSVPIVSFGGKNDVLVEYAELCPKRDLRHIKGTMGHLLDKKNVMGQNDFIYVTLTDEEIINDAMTIFQQVYPNTIKIDYDNSYTKEIQPIDIEQIANNRSFDDMIAEFYYKMYGCEITEEERKVMKEIAKEVGVSDEAD